MSGFPYTGGALATQTLTFDPTTGQLDPLSATTVTVPVPNGANLVLDMSGSSSLDTAYTLLDATVVNGNGPSPVDRIEIAEDGTLYTVFESGTAGCDLQNSFGGRGEPRQHAAAHGQRVRADRGFR